MDTLCLLFCIKQINMPFFSCRSCLFGLIFLAVFYLILQIFNRPATLVGLHSCGYLSHSMLVAFVSGLLKEPVSTITNEPTHPAIPFHHSVFNNLALLSCCYHKVPVSTFPLSKTLRDIQVHVVVSFRDVIIERAKQM